jgi:uncharacterized protein YozE (UPF0346 family)
MTFRAWLREQQHRDDPVGDLARVADQDNRFPRRNAKLRKLVRHLEEQEAVPGAKEALHRAWGEWSKLQARTPGGWAHAERSSR